MKKLLLLPLLLFLFVPAFAKEALQPPVAKKVPRELKIHGDTLVDNYFWLRENAITRMLRPTCRRKTTMPTGYEAAGSFSGDYI